MQLLNPQKAKLNILCSFVNSHVLNQTCCRRRIAEQGNIGVVLGKVEGFDADVGLDLRDELP